MSMKTPNFAVFILTHGRSDNVTTAVTLRKQGYTGKIYYVIDDEDDQEDKYRENFGDSVLQFCKQDYIDKSDTMDTGGPHGVILFARNATFDFAKKLGVKYFLMCDDDYKYFYIRFKKGEILQNCLIPNLDEIFDAVIDFLVSTNSCTVAFAQGGDFIGGVNGDICKKVLPRKAMNTFFFKTDTCERFIGRLNEDVNFYILEGYRGKRIFTIIDLMIDQPQTQKQENGATQAYLAMGTYAKSFYSVLALPSAVKISTMGRIHKRIHHLVNWNYCCPVLLNQKYRIHK